MDRRTLLLALPAVATALVVVVLFGPGQERPVVAARVMTSGAEPDGPRSLRIETIERGAPIPRPVSLDEVSLFASGQDTPLWKGRTGPAGVVEAALAAPLPPGSRVRVRTGQRTLAEGVLKGKGGPAPSATAAALPGVVEGDLVVSARIATGTLVPSIPGVVSVEVRDGAGLVSEATLAMTGSSVEPPTLEVGVKDGRALLPLTAIAPPAVIDLTAKAGSRSGTLRVELPTVMGAIAASIADDELTLVSPAPRDVAFVSLFDDLGRTGGGVVELQAAPDGFFRGKMPIGSDVRAVTVSSDAYEVGASTVTWPGVERSGAASAPRLTIALDGMPAAVAAETTRLARVRTATTAALSLAAALEIALLLWTRRDARGALPRSTENAPERGGDSHGAPRPVWGFLAAISALVLLALAAVVGLVVMR
ncbi:MAG: hypothetical protein JNL21_27025 [Myxococcales bacterium]|nr:hypothetical protein [Myxococcales bacterium]